MSLPTAALEYAELGYRVFPCIPGAKAPATPHGSKDATTDPEQIEAWWERTPQANIGMSTDGLLVVDVDGADNPWPADTKQTMELCACPISRTPSGGRHHVFKQPPGADLRNTAGKLAPKVDTRADGGYIVVPPSVVGEVYTWLPTYELTDPPDQLAEPPPWIMSALIDNSGVLSQAATDANEIPPGQRNDTLTRLAGTMRRVGMSEAEILAAITTVNQDRCDPPLGKREVARIAANVSRYEPDQVSVAVIEDHWGQDNDEAEDFEPVTEDPGAIPVELLRVPGFVSEVMDCCLETAPYPNQVMAFAGALALQAFLAGRKVRDPGDNRTNMYILGLAHSSAGKDWPRRLNGKILDTVGLGSCIGDKLVSGEGVQDSLLRHPCMLYQTDEIDGMLQSIRHAKDARHEAMMGALLTLYSAAASTMPMRAKAGKDSLGSIDQPCLVLLGTAIPNHLYEAMTARMLSNGLFARMLILESTKRAEGQEPGLIRPPDRVLATAEFWANYRPGHGNLADWHPEPAVVRQTDAARAVLIETRKAAEAEYAKAEEANDTVGTTVWGRVAEQVRKLALIYAVSERHQAPEIGVEAVKWARGVILHQTRRMLYQAGVHVSESEFDKLCLRVLAKLREAPRNTLRHSVLLKAMRVSAKDMGELIATLEARGDIEVTTMLTAGRSGRRYRLRGGRQAGKEAEKEAGKKACPEKGTCLVVAKTDGQEAETSENKVGKK